MSGADHSSRLAFVHSSVEKPTEIYFAEGVDKLVDARPITAIQQALHRA